MQRFILIISMFAILSLPVQTPAFRMPDTGQTRCYDNEKEIACPAPGGAFYGQDAQYQPWRPRSYTKLKHDGLSWIEGQDDPSQWIMTRDNVTGLIWEIKTSEEGLRNRENTYSWYNPDHAQSGSQNLGNCEGSACDTHAFIQALREESFGGFSDWRMPTRHELSILVNAGAAAPVIDTDWFPETVSLKYWSSNTYSDRSLHAWYVDFLDGIIDNTPKSMIHHVRAVRGTYSEPVPLENNLDGTITDPNTGLMWQQCSAGQTWNEFTSDCGGDPVTRTWQEALSYTENLTWADYSDWRLPNRNELESLIDDTTYNPAMSPLFRLDTFPREYWSSTTGAYGKTTAIYVYFHNGLLGSTYKLDRQQVRAVRSERVESFGSLTILIKPLKVAQAGARWRRAGTETWYVSDYTENNIRVGSYIIEFKAVPGWKPAEAITVLVQANTTTIRTGAYAQETATLPGVLMLLLDE